MPYSMEDSFAASIATQRIPNAILMAADATGEVKYAMPFGSKSVNKPGDTLQLDAVMSLASLTKLVTSIAALQLVERGSWTLDDDMSEILPELARLPILKEMKDGKGVLVARKNAITLRHLLTHSSGVAYGITSSTLQQYNESVGMPPIRPFPTVADRFNEPLLFEPGTAWSYGASMDWVGLAISRVTKISLDDYLQSHICAPLGIQDLTFWLDRKPGLRSRLVDMALRDPAVPEGDGGKVISYTGENIFGEVSEEFGGQGLYGSMPAYMEILRSLLMDDERLVKKETSAQMFHPQLIDGPKSSLQGQFSKESSSRAFVGVFPTDADYNWGLGGLLNMSDIKEDGIQWRRKNTLIWSGFFNLYWFVDRKSGLCGLYGSQILPAGDVPVREMIGLFDRTVYRRYATPKAEDK